MTVRRREGHAASGISAPLRSPCVLPAPDPHDVRIQDQAPTANEEDEHSARAPANWAPSLAASPLPGPRPAPTVAELGGRVVSGERVDVARRRTTRRGQRSRPALVDEGLEASSGRVRSGRSPSCIARHDTDTSARSPGVLRPTRRNTPAMQQCSTAAVRQRAPAGAILGPGQSCPVRNHPLSSVLNRFGRGLGPSRGQRADLGPAAWIQGLHPCGNATRP